MYNYFFIFKKYIWFHVIISYSQKWIERRCGGCWRCGGCLEMWWLFGDVVAFGDVVDFGDVVAHLIFYYSRCVTKAWKSIWTNKSKSRRHNIEVYSLIHKTGKYVTYLNKKMGQKQTTAQFCLGIITSYLQKNIEWHMPKSMCIW